MTQLHCDNDNRHRYSDADYMPGDWCPKCGEGAALRADTAPTDTYGTIVERYRADGADMAYAICAALFRAYTETITTALADGDPERVEDALVEMAAARDGFDYVTEAEHKVLTRS